MREKFDSKTAGKSAGKSRQNPIFLLQTILKRLKNIKNIDLIQPK